MTARPGLLPILASVVAGTLFAPIGNATYAIVACEHATGRCGVAVATHNLAVGDRVPFAVADQGAGVSQFETNPCHAPAALTALRSGKSAETALTEALDAASECPDGYSRDHRQIVVVAANGTVAGFTGKAANGFAGQRLDEYVAVAGNGLAGEAVLDAMWDHYHASAGPLAERLLQAMEAGHAAGGQRIGVLSAALRVSTRQGWPIEVDLRVDYAAGTAIADLRRAYNARVARTLLFRARREDDAATTRRLVIEALERAPNWDRIWLAAARLARIRGWAAEAGAWTCRFAELNPTWAGELADELPTSACETDLSRRPRS